MKKLSIVFGFKNRDVLRVERCLKSLDAQYDGDFEVIFVDYGSELPLQRAVKEILGGFSFVRYVYTEMRGRPWNRAHALNIGARLAQGDILMTTDIDLIFSDFSLRKMLDFYDGQSSLHATCHYLPEKFDKWHELSAHMETYGAPCKDALGLLMVLPRQTFLSIGGFDEFYHFWGAEDEDIENRLEMSGFPTRFLDVNEFPLYHQWHPIQNNLSYSFMPIGHWTKIQFHFGKNIDVVKRNVGGEPGRVVDVSERPVLPYLQGDIRATTSLSGCRGLDRDLARTFFSMKSGEVLEIKSTWLKPSTTVLRFISLANRIAKRLRLSCELVVIKNEAKELFWMFINEYRHDIKDYAFTIDEEKFYLVRE